MKNRYALYMNGISKEQEIKALIAEALITALILKFDEEYQKIKNKYPDVGIGDTASDECIVHFLYRRIHYGDEL